MTASSPNPATKAQSTAQALSLLPPAVRQALEHPGPFALGLDAWLDSLSGDDRQIIRLVFEDGYSYQAAAPMVNMSKPGLQYRINKICKNSIRV